MSDPTQTADAPATSTAAPVVEAAPAEVTTLLTAETPTEDAAPVDGEAPKVVEEKPKADDADNHAPEAYADFTLPENTKLDDEFLKEFKATAKELDLPQGKAQRLAEMGAKLSEKNATAFVSQLQATVDANAKAWEAAVKADPEIGGSAMNENMAVAKKALDTFGTPALKQFLNESRLGSNPELIRMLVKAGKAISQDSATPGRAAPSSKSDADVLYGTKA